MGLAARVLRRKPSIPAAAGVPEVQSNDAAVSSRASAAAALERGKALRRALPSSRAQHHYQVEQQPEQQLQQPIGGGSLENMIITDDLVAFLQNLGDYGDDQCRGESEGHALTRCVCPLAARQFTPCHTGLVVCGTGRGPACCCSIACCSEELASCHGCTVPLCVLQPSLACIADIFALQPHMGKVQTQMPPQTIRGRQVFCVQ